MRNKSDRIHKITLVAVFSAVCYVLSLFEIPAPFAPSFARMDFSNTAALIVSFAAGPWAGVSVELIKNLLKLLSSNTAGIGELANFAMGCAFVIPAGLIYQHHKTKRTALLGCVIGSIVSGIVSVLLNYYVLLPLFSGFTPMDQLLAMYGKILPVMNTKWHACLWAFPVNVFQCGLYSLITMIIYKPLSPLLHGHNSVTYKLEGEKR